MKNPRMINPYYLLGAHHQEALDFIIANLPPNPTFFDLNTQLAAFYFAPDAQDPDMSELIGNYALTILPHVYNGYVNGGALRSTRHSERSEESPTYLSEGILRSQSLPQNDGGGYWRYNEHQMRLIHQMLNGIYNIPVESIDEYLNGIDEDITAAHLSTEEQIPLLIATIVGRSDRGYWMTQIETPGAWAAYLNPNPDINYMHVAGWVNAAMQGVLLAYGVIKPPQIQPVDVLSASIGSIGMAAGKVMFGWIGRG